MYTGEKAERGYGKNDHPPVAATGDRKFNIPDGSRKKSLREAFVSFIQDTGHPCLAAHSVVNNEGLKIGNYASLGAAETASVLAGDLKAFVKNRKNTGAAFASFVAVFDHPVYLTEEKFEQLLWQQLQLLHEQDNESWDPKVSPDPEDGDFSYSFAGKGLFIIGLHPGSSRKARSFYKPALVFNLHEQFEQLKEEGKFEKMRDLIRTRDTEFQGTVNPMAEDYGTGSEAKQYSGRKVEDTWKCPFLNHQLKK